MQSIEVISAMLDHSMAEAEARLRAGLTERGMSISDDQVQQALEPLRHHLIVAYTDNVEAVRGL